MYGPAARRRIPPGGAHFVGGEALSNIATATLHGEGVYEGLTATLMVDQGTQPSLFTAGIVEGDLPALPEAD